MARHWLWLRVAKFNIVGPLSLSFAGVVATAVAAKAGGPQVRRSFVRCGVAFLTLVLCTTQLHNPFYLWFFTPVMGLIVIDQCELLWQGGRRLTCAAVGAVALAGLAMGASHDVLRTSGLILNGPEQRWPHNAELVSRLIPPGATVITSDHWYSLAKQNRIYDPMFSRIDAFNEAQYVVLTGNGAGAFGTRLQLEPEFEAVIQRDFEVIHDNLNHKPLTLLGLQIGHSSYGMGCVVLKRRS
jgi:hypothetical protein